MKKFIIILIGLSTALTGRAQTFIEHLQEKPQAGQGTITVVQSKEITDLVNGRAALPKINKPANTTPSKPKEKKEAEHKKPVTAYVDTITTSAGKKMVVGGTKVDGYRVQVYAGGNSREDKRTAQRIGAEVKALFPEQPVFVHFNSPRWICRVGNFRSQEEANELLQALRKLGYSESSLIKGKITVK